MNNVYTCVSERDGGREKERELNGMYMYVVLCASDCMQCVHTVHVNSAQF